MIPRLLFAAPASGSGKTTVVMGLLRCLSERGMNPAAFKCGPDFIDPMFHREVLGVPGRNLDLYLAAPETVRGLLTRGAAGAGVAVIEGVMGYFDGVGDGDGASSWRVAAETGTPAVLVMQPKGAFLSLAALVNGFAGFRRGSMLRGVVLNRCNERLYRKLAPLLERETGLRVYGHIPDIPEAVIESRHLGLITPDGIAGLRDKIQVLAGAMKDSVDIDGLLRLAAAAPDLAAELPAHAPLSGAPVDIAVARDGAFCFYYEENLELLREFGARLTFFSPLADKRLPDGMSGLYFGGGYPELYAPQLSGNRSMLESVTTAIGSGLPTIAECGGFLYLQERLTGRDGREYPMAGALAGTGRDTGRLVRFGYMEMEGAADTMLVRRGETIRAHEFHRWDSDANGDAFAARKRSGGDEWRFGYGTPALYAGFPHLYFWNNPRLAERFVQAAILRSKR